MHSRRTFLQAAGAAALAPLAAAKAAPLREYTRGGMVYRQLGATSLFVSQLSFGSHTDHAYRKPRQGGSVLTEEGQARRDQHLAHAFDLGVNLVDVYENESQWEPTARVIKPRRDKVMLSLSLNFPEYVGATIDRAARLFGYTDLFRIHIDDWHQVDAKTLEDWDVMRRAKEAGKIRAIGIATHTETTMLNALTALEGLDYIFFPYNFIHGRADYSEFLPLAQKKQVGLVAIKPLAAGSIVNLDPRARSGPKPETETAVMYGSRNHNMLPAAIAELTRSLNRMPDETLCQAAIRFVYSRPFITCAIPGMWDDQWIDDNYAALRRAQELGREERSALDAASQVALAYGKAWLPERYQWLEERWRR